MFMTMVTRQRLIIVLLFMMMVKGLITKSLTSEGKQSLYITHYNYFVGSAQNGINSK